MSITFTVTAYTHNDAPSFFQVKAFVTDYAASNAETREAARAAAKAIVAQLPKSIGMVATTCTRHESGHAEVSGYVSMSAKLAIDGVNGGKNEAGIKRYRSLRKHLARLGYAVEYRADASNSYPTLEAFEAAL